MSLPVNSLYSLTWGDYGTSLVSAVQLLRCHGDLVDVTLAAEGRSFEAHKIVLCAASPYLLNLLKVSAIQSSIFYFSFPILKINIVRVDSFQ
jgi:BTB/POZ domain